MASLMQNFAKARQQRLIAQAELVANYQQGQSERFLQFQAQAASTAKVLAHSHQKRLAAEQGRQALAANAQEQRLEEFQTRAAIVHTQLQQTKTERLTNAVSDSMLRGKIVQLRASAVNSQISHIRKARLIMATLDYNLRQAVVKNRASAVHAQSAKIRTERIAKAKLAQSERASIAHERTENVRSQLQDISTNRTIKAEALEQLLRDYRTQISQSVWGDGTESLEPIVVNKPSISVPLAVAVKTEVAEIKIVTPEVLPEPSSPVEEFIHNYLGHLEGNLSLLDVVNNRDIVRDLLAQGANSLKVDPSEILNALLRMANLS